MVEREHKNYMIRANSRQDPPPQWVSWFAVRRLKDSEPEFPSPQQLPKRFDSQDEAEEAALGAGQAWVDKYGQSN